MAELRLEQKLALKQILTPQLIQTLNLLLLPRLELEEAIKLEIEENPFLEVKEEEVQEKPDNVETTLADWRRFFDGMRLFPSVRDEIDKSELEEEEREPIIPEVKSLFEYLAEQIELVFDSEREKTIALEIIGNLDERGFLSIDTSEIAESLAKKGVEPPVTNEELELCRKHVMKLDPPGLGAKDIRESFLAQLEAKELSDTLAYEIVRDHFDLLINKNFSALKKKLDITDDELFIAISDLRGLSFSPALDYGKPELSIVPDISFEKLDGEWVVIYNKSNIPPLNINKSYLELLRKEKELDERARVFLRDKLERAKAWVKALIQREETILRLGKEILARQLDFFEKGVEHLKPMTMEDVAKSIGVHTSTIHRIVKGKYAQTPFGVFPLKFFFSRGYVSQSGEEVSAKAIKEKIRELINSEDKKIPLSDEEISNLLKELGFKIARRTVAKYRESMGIPPARFRKEIV